MVKEINDDGDLYNECPDPGSQPPKKPLEVDGSNHAVSVATSKPGSSKQNANPVTNAVMNPPTDNPTESAVNKEAVSVPSTTQHHSVKECTSDPVRPAVQNKESDSSGFWEHQNSQKTQSVKPPCARSTPIISMSTKREWDL